MPKRKQADTAATEAIPETPSSKRARRQPVHDATPTRSGSATPKPNGKTLFATTTPQKRVVLDTPSKRTRADQSAKRKSATVLAATAAAEDDWEGENALAEAILEAEENDDDDNDDGDATAATAASTPKRGRGRPKGSRNKRSPTPEGADIAPEERYFYQNRTGPVHLSNNVFSSVKLLTHDEYLEQVRLAEEDAGHHGIEKSYLMKLHRRSFPQWKLELDQGYSVCLYGYGSKRILTTRFAEWLYARSSKSPTALRIVIVNGYTAKLTVRTILNTIASSVVTNGATTEGGALKLSGPPQEMLDTLLAHLSTAAASKPRIVVAINSIDASSLNKTSVQDILARLASHEQVQVVATADTPFFSLLWNSNYLDLFNFAFHDCTTFTPYDAAELPVVDQVYDLLGRKGRRMGGKEGIKYVLKSLPPNAQNLYRILLGEILSILVDDNNTQEPQLEEEYHEEDDDANDYEKNVRKQPRHAHTAADEDVGIEYRRLYQKASEEFVASSDMNFRFLLKEFHDHQMITSRRDASGTELLCVPLGREEMQAVLEDLVVS